MNRFLVLMPLLAVVAVGCKSVTSEVGCIQPPPKAVEITNEQAAKIAASVPEIVTNGELSGAFKQAVKASYAEIQAKEAAQLMWLNAIDCYLRHGKVGEQIALKMADFVIASYAGSKQQGSEKLTVELMKEIDATPWGGLIRARYAQFHIEPK